MRYFIKKVNNAALAPVTRDYNFSYVKQNF
jgi:hypothetical protein